MSVWSARRQVGYTLIILIVAFLIAGGLLLANRKNPSCSDNTQNQGELGVDCGGPCNTVCASEATDLVVRWVRVFKVKEGVYDVAARIDNPNVFGIAQLAYHFKLYDEQNVLVREARGTTFVNPDQSFIIFATGIETGFEVPTKAFVEFTSQSDWIRYKNYKKPTFTVKDKTLTLDPAPRVAVTIGNDSLFDTSNIEVVAVVLDSAGNAIGSSKTTIDTLAQGQAKQVFFTWPEPFDGDAAFVEVYPRINSTKQ